MKKTLLLATACISLQASANPRLLALLSRSTQFTARTYSAHISDSYAGLTKLLPVNNKIAKIAPKDNKIAKIFPKENRLKKEDKKPKTNNDFTSLPAC